MSGAAPRTAHPGPGALAKRVAVDRALDPIDAASPSRQTHHQIASDASEHAQSLIAPRANASVFSQMRFRARSYPSHGLTPRYGACSTTLTRPHRSDPEDIHVWLSADAFAGFVRFDSHDRVTGIRPTGAGARVWPAGTAASSTMAAAGMRAFCCALSGLRRCAVAEFLAGVVVSGWVISWLGLRREATLRPRLPKVSRRVNG